MQYSKLSAALSVGVLLLVTGAGCTTAPEDQNQPAALPKPAIESTNPQAVTPEPARLTDDDFDNSDDDNSGDDDIKAGATPRAADQGTVITPAASPAPAVNQQIQEITITGKDWKWLPETIKIKKGTRVRLKITSGDIDHGLALPDYNINVMLEPGKTQTVEFTADKAGSFTYYCSVPCGPGHKAMRGTIIVE